MNIPIAKSYFGNEELMLAGGVIRSGWIAQGPMVERFEEAVRRYTGAGHAVASSSGTSALHMALVVAGVGPGDAVIVPSFSFIATANAVAYCGAKPVFIDIDPSTYNIDPAAIERYLAGCRRSAADNRPIDRGSGRTIRAIMPVHQFGLPCDLDAISRVAGKYKLSVIEDAACALGSLYRGKQIGRGSMLACFSFHPRKIITTGEGGMLVTGRGAYADRARILRNHGSAPVERYDVLGYNYRLTDLAASIGMAQMSRLPEILKRRAAVAGRYDAAFGKLDTVEIPRIPSYAVPNYQSYVIRIKNGCGLSRDEIVARLLRYGISTRRGNTAIHMQPVYRNARTKLPFTEAAALSTLALPIYFEMTRSQQDFVIEKVVSLVAKKRR